MTRWTRHACAVTLLRAPRVLPLQTLPPQALPSQEPVPPGLWSPERPLQALPLREHWLTPLPPLWLPALHSTRSSAPRHARQRLPWM